MWCVLWSAHGGLRFIRYFELSCARCGSSYIDEMLDSHPCVYTMGEKLPLYGALQWLRRIKTGNATASGRSVTAVEFRAAQDRIYGPIEARLDEEFERKRRSRRSGKPAVEFSECKVVVVGGKLPYERLHTSPKERFEGTLALFSPVSDASSAFGPSRVIFNLRMNSLDRVLSRFAPALYGAEHVCTESGMSHCMKETTATLEIPWLLKNVKENRDAVESVKDEVLSTAQRLETPLVSLRYEDLLRDGPNIFRSFLLPFLDLDPHDLHEGHVKRTGNLTHADMITNYDQVASALTAAGMADDLVDERTRRVKAQIFVLNPLATYAPRDRPALRGAVDADRTRTPAPAGTPAPTPKPTPSPLPRARATIPVARSSAAPRAKPRRRRASPLSSHPRQATDAPPPRARRRPTLSSPLEI